MVGKEAWNSLMEGKKVRYVLWPENEYIYFDKKEYKIKNSYGIETIFYVSDIVEDAWELYEEDEPHSGRYAWGFRSNTMDFEEAKKALLDGKKVRCVDWSKGNYIYFDDKNLVTKDNNGVTQQHVYDLWRKREWELYEEPKKVIKVFVSQPMQGKSKCEITEERNKIKKLVEEKYGESYQIEYLNENLWERPKDWTRIQHLGCSIMNIYDADAVVFAPDWIEAHGCFVEHDVAYFYGKKIYTCVKEVDGEIRMY